MNRMSKLLVIMSAAAALTAVSSAWAQGFGPGCWNRPGMGGGPGMGGPGFGCMGGPGCMRGGGGGRGWMAANPSWAEQNLNQQRTELGIGPEQEAAWNQYAEAVTAQAQLRAGHWQGMMAGTIPADQRFVMRQQGLEQMQRVNQATRALYGVLTPEQQAKGGTLIGQTGCPRGNW